MKFQQSQVAFKEQIALLEQIKTKQLELEKMQKLQYKQEKKLLMQQANIKRLEKSNKKVGFNKADNLDQMVQEENGAINEENNNQFVLV